MTKATDRRSSTDAKTIDIYLVNNNVYPNVNTKIASGVDTSKGSYTFDLKGAKAGYVAAASPVHVVCSYR